MPKTYKTEIIGYTFSELSEEVKQKIYENDDFFSESVDFSPIEDTFRADLMECFGVDPDSLEVYYDVSYTQGSGACCVGTLDVKTVLEKRTGSYFAELLDMIESGKVEIDTINIVRCGPANFYNHENTCQVEIQYSHNPTEFADIISTTVELEQMLTNAIREELCDFHSKLQDHYEESTSFEAYCEYMCSSDVVFTEAGKIVDPVYIENSFVIDGYQLSLGFNNDHSDYNFT